MTGASAASTAKNSRRPAAKMVSRSFRSMRIALLTNERDGRRLVTSTRGAGACWNEIWRAAMAIGVRPSSAQLDPRVDHTVRQVRQQVTQRNERSQHEQ